MSTPLPFSNKLFFPGFLQECSPRNVKSRRREAVFFIFLCLFSACFVLAEEKIDINTASHEKLQKIIWVGPATAQKIIDARPFYSLDELVKVSGIGNKKLEDIKSQEIAWAGPLSGAEAGAPSVTAKEKQIAEPAPSEGVLKKEGGSLIIDINAASLQALQKIVGVGTVLGQRIIDARPFYSLDELVKVSGIGETMLENIKKQGLAWVDPDLTSSKTEKPEIPNKELTAMSAQQTQGKKLPESSSVLLAAFFLSFFSGIIILILKRSLKSAS